MPSSKKKKTPVKGDVKGLVKTLYGEMIANDLVQLKWEDKEYKLKLTRKDAFPAYLPAVHAADSAVQKKPEMNSIKSPMNGIFYIAPSPGADPFVRVGDEITQGTTVCILEAMKLMNEVQVDRDCKILSVLVENGEAVKINQPLFEVEDM
ncbi:MAG: hypothetical protein JXJ19_05585 [Elusimicrobia bacterium]|nr:hypothetical protein [Elusimicrobiota bacterium]